MMDSEPGRCRRTDGRKWRCSRDVIPLQKYCQRHMHRGRQGSRKHVEEPIHTTDSRGASDDTRMPVASLLASDVDTRVSTSCISGFPLILKCRNDETRGALFSTSSTGVEYGRSSCACSRAHWLKSGFDGNPMDLSGRKQNFVGSSSYPSFDSSSRYGLSPKSVLNAAGLFTFATKIWASSIHLNFQVQLSFHCSCDCFSPLLGKIGLGSGRSSTIEAEPQRCRRTDGKKWRCRRDALHTQKYCEAHMHRGAKRVVVKPEHSRHPLSTPMIDINLDIGMNLNTVPESPQRGTSNNSCSSTSDATTITD